MGTDLAINSAGGLQYHNTAFRIMFEDSLNNAVPGPYANWTETLTAEGEQRITLAWLANTPTWRKWTGGRRYKNLRAYQFTVTQDSWEATLPMPRKMVEHDKSGVVGRTLSAFVQANIVDGYDSFVATEFDGNSGAGPTGFDGVALYSTAHPHAPAAATQSNLGSGTNLSHSSLVTAEQTMMLWVEENSRPVRSSPNLMRVGPKLKRRAQELLSADRMQYINTKGVTDLARSSTSTDDVVGGATRSSVWSGDMDLVVDPRVTTFYWDLFDTRQPFKPMILFVMRAPEPVNKTEMTDDERFEYDNYIYSVECDIGTSAGHWYATYRGTGTE